MTDLLDRLTDENAYAERGGWKVMQEAAAALRDAHARIAELRAARDYSHEQLLRTNIKLTEILVKLEELAR